MKNGTGIQTWKGVRDKEVDQSIPEDILKGLNDMGKKLAIFTILIAALLLNLPSIGCKNSSDSGAKDAANTFLTYWKAEQWNDMWEMLHPDSQALFENRDDCTAQMKNSLINLKGFTIRSVQDIPQWTCDSTGGTNKTYSDVAEIQVNTVVSTMFGNITDSQTIHCVKVDDSWKFFYSDLI